MNETTDLTRTIDCPLPLAEHPVDWEPENIAVTLQKLQQQSRGAEVVCLSRDFEVPPDAEPAVWPMCAAAAAIAPACLQLQGRDVLGEHSLICTPFPIDAGGCDCGIRVEVHEMGKRAVAIVTIDPLYFDYLRFDSIVAPPVGRGMQVFIRGSLPLPLAVSLVLSYAQCAESVWIQERVRSGKNVCVYSKNPEELGRFASEQLTMIGEGQQ